MRGMLGSPWFWGAILGLGFLMIGTLAYNASEHDWSYATKWLLIDLVTVAVGFLLGVWSKNRERKF